MYIESKTEVRNEMTKDPPRGKERPGKGETEKKK
jgi:hypothetical protein